MSLNYKYPYENELCCKCIYSYTLDAELRCCKIKIGMSDCMCARVNSCADFRQEIKSKNKKDE